MPDRSDRKYGDKDPDNRNCYQRDRDRILYTSAFRRLAEVTQVVAADEGHVFHNRLTHSLEVAQFGRRLAEILLASQRDAAEGVGGIDPDVTEAAAMAHDIGHPPFGHIAEQELNALVTAQGLLDGFEGNAQSFRIVNKLALNKPEHPGLNLTRATTNAILKYPWPRGTGGKHEHKWGAYQTEREELAWARELSNPGDERKCPEAELMDWADDVTYAVHDATDFFRAGLIPLERLASTKDDTERNHFFAEVFARHTAAKIPLPFTSAELANAFTAWITYFPIDEPYRGSVNHRALLRMHTSVLIKRYIHALRLQVPRDSKSKFVIIDPQCEKEVFMLKQLTWHYVILNPALTTIQFGQRRIIKDLFEIYCNAAKKRDLTIFPFVFHEHLDEATTDDERVRIIADLISGMTERQAIRLHNRLTGISLGSALDQMSVS